MVESEKVFGYQVLAEALQLQGITACFGIVGVPVSDIAFALQGVGVDFLGFRNE
jgi:thiamine pyrophosphate-dependent acetolactate synthase large subunit-like protein